MILGDRDLRRALSVGEVSVTPEPPVHGCKIDLRVGTHWQVYRTIEDAVTIDTPLSLYTSTVRSQWWEIDPGEYVLVYTEETVTIGSLYVGLLSTRSRVARMGLSTNAGSLVVDAGFSGKILLELHNVSRHRIRLNHGDPIVSLSLIRVNSPCAEYRGVWYGQG